ncbi:MAG TPA: hypothetical protein VNU45_06435 [Rummeliibacillus sp.]|nr:hypothetical protein [Rummeliibacillus sp.]
MTIFLNDVAGVIYDFFKMILTGLSYLMAGMILVAIPFYLFVWIVGFFK